ncbi:MAG TPA: glycosyltransferase family 39 protein [Oligoflexia bacterium]|nr:glycosyltransferase family 39 protein [Oligoflexia bacterium]HMP27090.1 glycosyltransferase family 39 protein [Oligoflexia bacterium]
MVVFLRLIGICLLVITFLPYYSLFPDIRELKLSIPPEQWFFGILAFSPIVWLISLFFGFRLSLIAERLSVFLNRISLRAFCLTTFFAVLPVLLVLSEKAFNNRPQNVDAVAQRFQGKIFAVGALYAPAPKYPEFFSVQHILVDDGKWYSQYPPGHSLVFALGELFGVYWLPPIILAALTPIFFYLVVLQLSSRLVAVYSTILLCFSGFFLFMSVGMMNHVPTFFFVMVTCYAFLRWFVSDSLWLVAIAGLSLGYAFLCRPLCAMITAITLSLYTIIIRRKKLLTKRNFQALVVGGLSALFMISPFFIYNYYTTGNALIPGYIKLWGASHGLGFHKTPWGDDHNLLTGIRNTFINIHYLNEYLFEWPIPATIILALALLFGFVTLEQELFFLMIFLAYPIGYLFYWHRDSFLGPRFIYNSLIGIIPLTTITLCKFNQFFKKINLDNWRQANIFYYGLPNLIPAAVFSLFLYMFAFGLPLRYRIYESWMTTMKRDLAVEAKLSGITKGLVFIKGTLGARIISELRGFGVPADLVETVYRRSDHCQLLELINMVKAGRLAQQDLPARMTALMNPNVIKSGLGSDDSFRSLPNQELSAECQEELAYDRLGAMAYAPFVADNDPFMRSDFIFAIDLRVENCKLIKEFSEFPPYLYVNEVFLKIDVSAFCANESHKN